MNPHIKGVLEKCIQQESDSIIFMRNLFLFLGLILACSSAVYIISCGPREDDDEVASVALDVLIQALNSNRSFRLNL